METNDYGADPMGDGTFKMVPSGDIVGMDERNKRLEKYRRPKPADDIFGMSWGELESKQGGRLTRPK